MKLQFASPRRRHHLLEIVVVELLLLLFRDVGERPFEAADAIVGAFRVGMELG